MTESVSGYRTLAQLGSAMPAPPNAPLFAQPALPFAVDPSLPPYPTSLPRWSPVIPFEPYVPATGEQGEHDAREGTRQPAPPRDGYEIPFLGLRLPGIRRTIEGVGGSIWEFHPNDPTYRLTGRHQQPRPFPQPTAQPSGEQADPQGTAAPDRPQGTDDGGERSGIARTAMMVGIGGGLLMNAVDVARTVKKYPEALRAARFDPALGRLGRLPTALGLTLATRPDARLIDPLAPRVASAASLGKSFTRFDEVAMKSSVLLGTSLAALQLASAVPNLADALGKDGPWYENLAMSTSGRAGILQLAGGSLGLGVFLTALKQTRDSGATNVVERVMAAAKAPVMARPIFTTIGIGSGMLVMANELGYLDFLNTGETRSVPTVLKEAVHKTPVLNDQEFRTAGLLVAGGVVGYKAHRAITAAGGWGTAGLSGLGKGHWIGGALVAGLLGAQLLGGLDVMNKPADPE